MKRGGGHEEGSSGTRVRLCPGGSNYKHHFKQYESHNSVFSFINLKTSSLRLHFQFYNRVCFIVNIVPTPSWLCTTAVKYSSIYKIPWHTRKQDNLPVNTFIIQDVPSPSYSITTDSIHHSMLTMK